MAYLCGIDPVLIKLLKVRVFLSAFAENHGLARGVFHSKITMNTFFSKQNTKEKFLVFSWGLYDLANQLFALNIVSLYFVRWVTIEKQVPELFYSISFGVSMFFVALLGPFLGTISDLLHRHRYFLTLFTLTSVIFTIFLGLTENIFLALVFFAVANFGCQISIIFYNALLVNITPKGNIGFVSGIGKMLGYCGALVGLFIIRPLVLEHGYRAAFIPSGLLFLIFSLPCLFWVRDKKLTSGFKTAELLRKNKLFSSIKKIYVNAFELIKIPDLVNFLKAAFFFLCVVNIIIIFMSVYVTRVFGLEENQFINFVLFSTVFAILGCLLSGYFSDRIGYRRSLFNILILWIACLLFGAIARSMIAYFLIGPLVGIALGSTWVVSRALAVKIVPPYKMGQAFGLFSLIGYLSAIVGVFLWGVLIWFLSPLGDSGYRLALLALIFVLLPSFFFLRRIKI